MTTLTGTVLLTGTVAQPADAEEAERLVQAFVGDGTQVISRLRTATPQQVMLQVKIAEVSRSLVRQIGINWETSDPTGGNTELRLFRGNNVISTGRERCCLSSRQPGATTLGLLTRGVFGLDVANSLDLNETNGLVTTLAEPTLTALSGETASFLAGGEFPIPISQSLGAVTIEYKQYRRRPRLHPDRPGGRPHLDARPPGSLEICPARARSG